MTTKDHSKSPSGQLSCRGSSEEMQYVFQCGRFWRSYVGGGWIDRAVEPLALFTEQLIPVLWASIQVNVTPRHADRFKATIKTHLSRLRAWERQHPRTERKLKGGRVKITRRGYKSIVVISRTADEHNPTSSRDVAMRDQTPIIVMESAVAIAHAFFAWVNILNDLSLVDRVGGGKP